MAWRRGKYEEGREEGRKIYGLVRRYHSLCLSMAFGV